MSYEEYEDTEGTPGEGSDGDGSAAGDTPGGNADGDKDEGGASSDKDDADPLVDENLVDLLFAEYGDKDDKADDGSSGSTTGEGDQDKDKDGGAGDGDASKDADGPDGSAAPKAEVGKVDLNDPEVRAAFGDWYRTLQASEEQSEAARAKLEEVEELVQAGDTEKLGEMFITEWTQTKATRGLAVAAQKQMLTETYKELYSHPSLQNLSEEELAKINPKTFQGNDQQYINHVHQFIASKEAGNLTDEQIEERVKERIKARANEARGKKVSGASASDLPGAQSGGSNATDDDKSSGDLLAEGFSEMVSGVAE